MEFGEVLEDHAISSALFLLHFLYNFNTGLADAAAPEIAPIESLSQS